MTPMTRLGIGALVIAIAVSGSFAAGWKVKGWKNDSEQAAIERAAKAIADKALERESGIAAKVEERLAELQANKTVIDRGIVREIEKPIYRNVCLGPDAIRLLNDAARGEPTKPSPAMPSRTITTD